MDDPVKAIEALFAAVSVMPCECKAGHLWIAWNGYQAGPFAPETARLVLGAIENARGQAIAAASDPMAMMALAAIGAIPPAAACVE